MDTKSTMIFLSFLILLLFYKILHLYGEYFSFVRQNWGTKLKI